MTISNDFCIGSDIDRVDWQNLADVFERAPLGKRPPELLRQVFSNSTCYGFGYLGAELIAAGRILTDRLSYALILDVVVTPERQGQGYGRCIMEYLTAGSGAKNIILHAVPAKQGFYAALGYRRLKTAMALFEKPDFWLQQGYIE